MTQDAVTIDGQGTKQVEWTYIGQRVLASGKQRDCWIDESGESHYFDKWRGASIGAVYEVRVVLDHDGDIKSALTAGEHAPRYLHRIDDEEQRLAWAARERADLTVLEQQRRAKREGSDPIAEACAPLREQYGKLIGHSRRAAFLAAVIEQVTS